MSVLVCTRDEALEALVEDAIRRAGWACECVAPCELNARVRAGEATALVLDADAHDLAALGRAAPMLPVIALLPDGAPALLIAAAAAGVRIPLRKPFTRAALERALAAVLRAHDLRSERPLAFAPAMRSALARVEALAAQPLTATISGETGTGKTHLARWLHAHGERARGPLVEAAGATLASVTDHDPLLHGGEPGAPGLIESAAGGMLLIEDVAELASEQQLALLRFLVDGLLRVDARVLATSRRGIARDVSEGRLHPDLATRLSAEEISLAPLRERGPDLAPLARKFAERAARAAGEEAPKLDDETFAALRALPFPGNLHELESLMQRAALLFPGRRVELARLGRGAASARAATAPAEPTRASLDLRVLERDAIGRALAASGGDRTLAARALGIHVRTLRNKLRAQA